LTSSFLVRGVRTSIAVDESGMVKLGLCWGAKKGETAGGLGLPQESQFELVLFLIREGATFQGAGKIRELLHYQSFRGNDGEGEQRVANQKNQPSLIEGSSRWNGSDLTTKLRGSGKRGEKLKVVNRHWNTKKKGGVVKRKDSVKRIKGNMGSRKQWVTKTTQRPKRGGHRLGRVNPQGAFKEGG